MNLINIKKEFLKRGLLAGLGDGHEGLGDHILVLVLSSQEVQGFDLCST